MFKDWHAMAANMQFTLAENGTEVDTDWLADLMPELFTNAEFKGGLKAFDLAKFRIIRPRELLI